MLKRFLAMFLAMTMVVSMLPTSAFAAEMEEEETEIVEETEVPAEETEPETEPEETEPEETESEGTEAPEETEPEETEPEETKPEETEPELPGESVSMDESAEEAEEAETEETSDITSIVIDSLPKKISYFVDDTLDLTGLEVYGVHADGTASLIPNEDLTVDCDMTQSGKIKAVVSYGDLSAEFEIQIHVLGSGEILQPKSGYPESAHNYANSADEFYKYSVTSADYLKLTFSSSTAFENSYDYLYIYDGSGNQVGKYTGTTLAGKTVQVTGNSVRLRLTSDGSTAKYGFSLTEIYAGYNSDVVLHEPADTGMYTQPTCIADGYTTYLCRICDIEMPPVVDSGSAGHKYRNGYCTGCGLPEKFSQSGKASDTVLWGLTADKVLYVYGTGSIPSDGSWVSRPDTMVQLEIMPGITAIGNGAFRDFPELTSITIPDTVTKIYSYAFYNDKNVANLFISSVESWLKLSISDYTASPLYSTTKTAKVYINDELLDDLVIPAGTTQIPGYAFVNWDCITSVTIPGSVTKIGSNAFYMAGYIEEMYIDSVESWLKVTLGTSSSNPLSPSTKTTRVYVNNVLAEDLVIPAGTTEIKGFTFENWDCIASVTIPDSVTKIGSDAFDSCANLKELYISSVESWLKVALSNSSANPMYNSTSGNKVYVNGELLEDLVIPAGTTDILSYAFYRWDCIASVTIPESVTNVGTNVFYGCTNAAELYISSVESWLLISFKDGNYNPLYASGKKTRVYVNNELLEDLVIPSDTVAIPNYAFANWDSVVSAAIPNNTKSIGDYAFDGCSGLESVSGGLRVTSIGIYAFRNCSRLTGITFTDRLASIGNDAFYGCSSLTDVTIPDSVTSIGSYAFYGCSSLTNVTLPGSITSIGSNTFYNCSSLASITIPNSITSIGSYAFYGCSSLTSITIPNNVTSIGSEAFAGCVRMEELRIASVDHWMTVTLSTVNSNPLYSSGARAGILTRVYAGGKLLDNLVIPTGTTAIPNYAFCNWDSVVSVTIPNSVTSIGNSVFARSNGIAEIHFKGNLPTISSNAFTEVSCFGFYPTRNTTYKSAGGYGGTITWKEEVASGTVIAQGTCGTSLNWTLNTTGILSITGSGTMTAYESGKAPWYSYRSTIKKINISYGAKDIGSYAFTDLNQVLSVTMPGSITKIGSNAFRNCSSLTNIVIPYGVTNIDIYAFYGCSNLLRLTIPASVTNIGSYVFYNCSSLEELYIPSLESWMKVTLSYTYSNPLDASGKAKKVYVNNVLLENLVIPDGTTAIKAYTFSGWSGIASVTIPDSVTTIGSYAFQKCNGLTSVTIPDSVTSLGAYAFQNCSGLTGVKLPDGMTTISSYAFYNCTSLASVTIPDSVTLISSCAFQNCSSLTDVSLGSIKKIDNIAFAGCSKLASITIPASVLSIGSSAFESCRSLSSVRFLGAPPTISGSVFTGVTANAVCRMDLGWTDKITSSSNWGGNLTWVLEVGDPITITPIPASLTINVGDSIDVSALQLKLDYADGRSETISAEKIDGISIQLPETNTGGVYAVEMTFGTHTVQIPVYILERYQEPQTDLPESDHPYAPSANESYEISRPGADSLTLIFGPDTMLGGSGELRVLDADGNVVAVYTGDEAAGAAITVPGDTVTLVLVGDGTTPGYGFTLIDVSADVHVHITTQTVTPPTCSAQGYTVYTCIYCNETYTADYTDMVPHTYEDTVTAPTCTEKGFTTHVCSVCGDTVVDSETDMLPHTYVDTVTAPTCTAKGYTTHVCSVCGDSFTDSETEMIPHTYVDTVTAPTCSTKGYTTHVCSVCGDTYTDNVTDFAHAYVDTVTAPTCIAKGYTTHECSICGDIYVDALTDMIPHSYEDTVTAPTCTEKGYTTHVCSACGDTYQDHETDKVPHTYVDTVTAPTCTEKGYTTHVCSVCGDIYTDAKTDMIPHSYEDTVTAPTCTEKGYTTHVCSVCGSTVVDTETDMVPHTYVDTVTEPTCTEKGYTTHECSVCGYIYVDNMTDIAHAYVDTVTAPTCTAKGYTTHVCSICGDTYVDAETDMIPHSYEDTVTAPTCTAKGFTTHKCSVCGDTYKDSETDLAPHTYVDTVTAPTCTAKGYTTHVCSVCGDSYVDSETDMIPHPYEDTVTAPTCTAKGYTTHVCSVCGYTCVDTETDMIPHTYVDTVTAPTCIEKGFTTHKCSVCGDTYKDSETDLVPHTYVDTVTAPTCTAKGYTTHVCSVCGDTVVDSETDMIPHAYEDTVTAPTCTEKGYTTHVCSVCGDTVVDSETDVIPHPYEDTVTAPTCTTKGYTTHVCPVCGDTVVDSETEMIPHTYEDTVTEPTCTEKGFTTHKCSVCGDTYVDTETDIVPHTYEENVWLCDAGGHWQKCAVCGSETESEAHIPDKDAATSDEDMVCRICGYVLQSRYSVIEITAPGTLLISGGSMQLTAEFTPANYTGTEIVWSISDEDAQYASVSADGTLTAKTVTERHTVTVYAHAADGLSEPGSIEITICPVPAGVVIAEGSAMTVNVNDRQTVTVTAMFTNADAIGTIVWTSDDTAGKYGTLTDNGDGTCTLSDLKLPDGKPGTLTLTAKVSGTDYTASITLTLVTTPTAENLDSNVPPMLRGGASLQLKAVVKPNISLTDKGLSWKLRPQDTAFASITAKGKLKTKAVAVPVDIVVTVYTKSAPDAGVDYTIRLVPGAESAVISCVGADIVDGVIGKETRVDNKVQLTASVQPASAIQTGTWKSSSNSIAEVDDNGRVTFKKAGTVKITFTTSDGSKKSSSVKIVGGNPVKGMSIKGANTLTSGGKTTLTVSFTTIPTVKAVTWTSSDPSVAAVTAKGVVTAKTVFEEKTVTITARATDGSNKKAEHTITVSPKPGVLVIRDKEGNIVNDKTLYLDVNDMTLQLKAPAGTVWTSSSNKVAEVENGIVQAVNTGSVTITAKSADGSLTGKVTVKITALVTKLAIITDTSAPLISGKGKLTLKTEVNADAAMKTLTWTSSDPSVAAVSASGAVTAKAGVTKNTQVTIRATAKDGSGKFAEVTVTVIPAAKLVNLISQTALKTTDGISIASGEVLNGRTLILSKDTKVQLGAIVYPNWADAKADQNVTWKSSSAAVAEIKDGVVTAKKAGSVTITVKTADGKTNTVKLKFV